MDPKTEQPKVLGLGAHTDRQTEIETGTRPSEHPPAVPPLGFGLGLDGRGQLTVGTRPSMPEALGEGAGRRAAQGERAEGLAAVGAAGLEAGHGRGREDRVRLGRCPAALVPVTRLLELPGRGRG